MQVGLSKAGVIEVDHDINAHDINTTSEQVSTNETAGISILKVVVNPVALVLLHARVDVEAAVAERMDLLGQQLDSFPRVAENYRLRDLELVEQGRQAVQLLLFLQIRVVLRQATKSQLICWLNVQRLLNVLLLEVLNQLGISCTE